MCSCCFWILCRTGLGLETAICTKVHLSLCNYIHENFEALKVQVNGLFTKDRGEQIKQLGGKNPDNRSENLYHILLEVKIDRPNQGSNPQPSEHW